MIQSDNQTAWQLNKLFIGCKIDYISACVCGGVHNLIINQNQYIYMNGPKYFLFSGIMFLTINFFSGRCCFFLYCNNCVIYMKQTNKEKREIIFRLSSHTHTHIHTSESCKQVFTESVKNLVNNTQM